MPITEQHISDLIEILKMSRFLLFVLVGYMAGWASRNPELAAEVVKRFLNNFFRIKR